jgi:hypothetical protein
MLFSETIENRALADATISRLKAEARIESTRASLLRVGGYSIFVVCLGLGCSAAFLGYSSIKKAHSSSDEIAKVLSTAIKSASVQTKGEVRLLPDATVSLKPGTIVSLDPTTAAKVEPGGAVQVLDARSDFDPFTNRARPISGGSVVTNYTVFKEVKYSKGAVMTAWTFASNEHTTPTRQRCYYIERADQASASIVTELAVNGQIVPHARRPQIDTSAAATNCVWFNAQGGA